MTKRNANFINRHDIIPDLKVKNLFTSFLGFDKRITMASKHYSKITDLFFEQMADDLNNYKANQPERLQDEITEDDILLLMKRQRIVTEKQSIESVIHKYLPKEYYDITCQSAIAYNRLYPTEEDMAMEDYNDDDYYDNE